MATLYKKETVNYDKRCHPNDPCTRFPLIPLSYVILYAVTMATTPCNMVYVDARVLRQRIGAPNPVSSIETNLQN